MEIRPNNGWISIKDRRPQRGDGDCNGYVFVWHAFQGAILLSWDRLANSRFNLYWMPTDAAHHGQWMDTALYMPAPEDCDEQQCVLAQCSEHGLRVVNRHLIAGYPAWQRMPKPPPDYKELRHIQ